MLLYNPTDIPLQQAFPIRPPEIVNGSERHFPPKTFILTPGEVTEIPDEAGQLALENLSRRGVMQVKIGQDLSELRGVGRHRWYQSMDAEIRDFNQQQEERRAQGLPMLLADPSMRETLRRHEVLRKELEAETQQILDSALATGNPAELPARTAEEVLAVNQVRAQRMASFDRATAAARSE